MFFLVPSTEFERLKTLNFYLRKGTKKMFFEFKGLKNFKFLFARLKKQWLKT